MAGEPPGGGVKERLIRIEEHVIALRAEKKDHEERLRGRGIAGRSTGLCWGSRSW